MKKHISWIVGLALLSSAHLPVKAQEGEVSAQSLKQLLEQVRQGRARDNAAFTAREEKFRANRDKQKALLRATKADIKREEARSERLEKTFGDNEVKLAELEGVLNERLGVYGELFGIVRQVAGETRGHLSESLISGELPNRTQRLDALAQSKGLPAMQELDHLWFALQQEMTAQGEVKSFTGTLVNLDGASQDSEILRVGPFTAMSEGRFIRYAGDGRFTELGRQPAARFGDVADALFDADTNTLTAAPVDPTRGAMLDLLLQMPSLGERINQGGLVGYLIILLGLFGVGLAGERIVRLSLIARTVKAEMASGAFGANSPLARIAEAYKGHQKGGTDALELTLDDAILKEMPPLERHLPLLKVLAGVAPLLGLLGTVTGMILTFQAITLFGTGDPKLMAGGISQALITTVLGLVVAIPILLLHAVAATRSREIVQILEEQAAGLLAAHAEKK